jgi:uncharacterized membrane protein
MVGLYVVFALAWYMYTASGVMFNSIVTIPQHIISNIGEFFNPVARESLVGTAIGADFVAVSTLGKVFRLFQYITQLFIIFGFIRLLLNPRGLKFRLGYVALAMVSALILFFCIVLPYFSGHLEVERFYHFSLFLLSPLCVLGGEAIWQGLSKILKSSRLKFKGWLASPVNSSHPSSNYLRFLALGVLIPYFLFNTGFIFEAAKSEQYNVVDTPSSETLSSYRMDMKSCNRREYMANEWLTDVIDDKSPIYADTYGALQHSIHFLGFRSLPFDIKKMQGNAYIYLRTWNIERREMVFVMIHGEHIWFEHKSFDNLPGLSELINRQNLVYDNGGAQVLAP